MKKTAEPYFDIDPNSLVQDRTLTFDVYIHLPLNDRVIIFKKKGATIEDLDQVKRMCARGLKAFHLLETDREAYDRYLRGAGFEEKTVGSKPLPNAELEPDAALPANAANPATPHAPPPVAPEVAKRQAEALAEDEKAAPPPPSDAKATALYKSDKQPEMLMNGLLKPPPENVKSRAEAVEMIKDILKKSGAPAAISEIVDNPDTEHATSVAIYSTLFAMGLKRNESQVLQDVIVSSLLHDIGLTQVDPSVLHLSTKALAGKQHAAFEEHVNLGLSLLGELDYKPNKRVIAILSQHHEKFNGSGFPRHLESFRIDELGQIIGIADLIDSIARGRYDGTVRALSDSLITIGQIEKTSTFPEYFNPDTFKRVMNWLKKGGGIDFLAAAEAAVAETKQKLLKSA